MRCQNSYLCPNISNIFLFVVGNESISYDNELILSRNTTIGVIVIAKKGWKLKLSAFWNFSSNWRYQYYHKVCGQTRYLIHKSLCFAIRNKIKSYICRIIKWNVFLPYWFRIDAFDKTALHAMPIYMQGYERICILQILMQLLIVIYFVNVLYKSHHIYLRITR